MKRSINIQDFIERSSIIHNNKYDYSLSIFNKVSDKIIIICPLHGEFRQYVNNHLNKKYGCKKCADDLKSMSIDMFIKTADMIHNKKYIYNIVGIINNRQKISIFCSFHGSFYQSILGHLSGNGCPSCRSSKGEVLIEEYLKRNYINFNKQYTFKDCINQRKLKFDFYIPEYNLCIEFDGIQHYKSIKWFGGEEKFNKTKVCDDIKTNFCLNNDINLFRISYKNLLNINDILKVLFKTYHL